MTILCDSDHLHPNTLSKTAGGSTRSTAARRRSNFLEYTGSCSVFGFMR